MAETVKPGFSNRLKRDLRKENPLTSLSVRSRWALALNAVLVVAIAIVWWQILTPARSSASTQVSTPPIQTVETQNNAQPTPTQQAPAPAQASQPAASGQTYTVASGDSLYSIAQKLGVDWGQLASINAIPAPYNLSIGQVLKVPAK